MNPKISVIIPTYNRAEVLVRAIKSVLSQTLPDFELIVVDDGSTDGTKKAVGEFIKRDNRVRYFWMKNSGGAAAPKNRGFLESSGKYIAYLDHDDQWLPTKLEKQIKLFEKGDKNLGLVSCNVIISKNGKDIGVHKLHKYKEVRDLLLEGGNYAFSNSSIMVPRSIIEKVGERDENLKLFEDLDIIIRIGLTGYGFNFVDEALVRYHIDQNNLSRDFVKASQDYERFIKKNVSILSKSPEILSAHRRHLGTMYMLAGQKGKARENLKRAIKIKPTMHNWITYLISLLGEKTYRAILNWKKDRAVIE